LSFKQLKSEGIKYVAAVAFVAPALLLRWWMNRELELQTSFVPFFLAVLASTSFGGWKPGCLTAFLIAAIADYSFIDWNHLPTGADLDYPVKLLVFLAGSACIIGVIEAQRRARRAAEALVRQLQLQIERQQQTEAQLTASEERYRSLFENNLDAVFTLDLEGFFTTANPSALKLCGYSLAELQQMRFTAFCSPEQCEEAKRHFQLCLRDEPEPFFELRIATKEGRSVDLFISGGPIKLKGKIVGVYAIAADVTERTRSQTLLTAFSQLGQRLSSVTTPVAAGRIIGDVAEELFGWDSFSLNLYSLENKQISYVLNVDTFNGEKTEILPFLSAPGIPALAHRVFRNGAELIAPPPTDVDEKVRLVDGAERSPSRMFVPIREKEKNIGVLSVGRFRTGAYDEQDLKALEALSEYCGGALQRIRAEGALRRNEEDYRALFDSDGSAKCQLEPVGGRFLRVNPKFCELTGYSERELLGKTFREVTHPEDRETSRQNFEKLLLGEVNDFRMEKRYERKDKTTCWVDTTVTLIRDAEGLPSRVIASSVDITDRKAAEEALAISNQRLALIASVANAVVGDEPIEEQMRTVAETVRAAYGTKACIIRVLEGEEVRLLSCAGLSQEVLKPRLPINGRLMSKILNERVPVFVPDLQALSAQPAEPYNVLGLVSYAGAPLLVHDKIIGVVGIFYGEPVRNFSATDLQQLQIIANHIAVAIANDRLFQEVKLQKAVLQEQVHERREIEEEVQKLNTELELRVLERTRELQLANGELEAFAYSVSHDLRGPLRSVGGFTEALKDEYEQRLDEQGTEYLNRVIMACREMDKLIDDMLHLSRLTRMDMKRQPVNLSALAEGILANLRETEPGREVVMNVTPGLVVPADARLLRIALENLLNNAWKFTGRKKLAKIEFGMDPEPGGPVYFVRDNGAGFDMEFADKLFGAFQRLHSTQEFPGHGIGLATVQRIINRHGGRTWAIGEVGCGATFYFTLPS